MCFVYIGFEIINNIQDLSVYAVVKAIIFPLNATVYLETDIFYFCCWSKDTIFVKSDQKS